MDADGQNEHLKAYGITYWILEKQIKVKWLLNYRGGSFLLPDSEEFRKEIRTIFHHLTKEELIEKILANYIAQTNSGDSKNEEPKKNKK